MNEGKILAIRSVGDPILKTKCRKINLDDLKEGKYKDLCNDLKETLLFNTNAYGLAAPQVGYDLRIIVINVKKEDVKYNDPQDITLTIMINLKWNNLDEEMDEQFEACASVPQIAGKVKRYKNIEIEYYDENGNYVKKEVNGFFARLIQHECDHLDGIVFLNRVESEFATKDMIKKYNLRES